MKSVAVRLHYPGSSITVEQAFGKVLRKRRIHLKISQESLAQDSDLDRTYVSLLERGQRQPSLRTIIKLCRTLKIPPDQIIKEVVVFLNENPAH